VLLENSIFALLAIFLLTGSITVIWAESIIYSAFGFLTALIAVAGLFALLNNSFLFLAQLMVSVGAVVVLTLIVIMTMNLKDKNMPKEPYKNIWIVFSSLLLIPFAIMLYKGVSKIGNFKEIKENFGDIKSMGEALFNNWILPFEIVSVLLLSALVGAIIIGRKELYR